MKIINLTDNRRKKRIWELNGKERRALDPKENGGTVQITAILSSKNYHMIQNGEAFLEIPHGVSMRNSSGSRELVFSCDDERVAEDLINGLENSGIPWDEDFETEDVGLEDVM